VPLKQFPGKKHSISVIATDDCGHVFSKFYDNYWLDSVILNV